MGLTDQAELALFLGFFLTGPTKTLSCGDLLLSFRRHFAFFATYFFGFGQFTDGFVVTTQNAGEFGLKFFNLAGDFKCPSQLVY